MWCSGGVKQIRHTMLSNLLDCPCFMGYLNKEETEGTGGWSGSSFCLKQILKHRGQTDHCKTRYRNPDFKYGWLVQDWDGRGAEGSVVDVQGHLNTTELLKDKAESAFAAWHPTTKAGTSDFHQRSSELLRGFRSLFASEKQQQGDSGSWRDNVRGTLSSSGLSHSYQPRLSLSRS